MATPRVAAGALFFNNEGRVLLVRPSYKKHWDIPGGYVEPGESPRSAARREILEELGIDVEVGSMLLVDWAPAEGEGDKILFVFDGGIWGQRQAEHVNFSDGEIVEARLVDIPDLEKFTPARLSRRIRAATTARLTGSPRYAEHGAAS